MSADLVVFGEDFGRHPASTEHLVRRLARDRKVIWMNSIGMRRPRFNRRDVVRAARKTMSMVMPATKANAQHAASPSTSVPASMRVVAPMAIPAPGSAVAFQINRALLSRQVLAQMALAGIERPVLWLTLPSALPVAGTLNERALVYYCGDDFGSLAGVDHEAVATMEREVVRRASLIIVCSDVLAAKFPAEKTLIVPHGVDFDLFATPAPRAMDFPVGRKVAGFYGSLPHWVDPALIARTAQMLPDWAFVFIGGGELYEPGAAPANVQFLGPKPHHELPGYVQHWDVSLLPFRDCEPLRAGNPLKLREYLAAGTPIASVEFPALAPYRDLVTVGVTPETFAEAIIAASKDGARNAMRQEAVRSETWEARAAMIDRALVNF